MLNGSGSDAKFTDLFGDDDIGTPLPKRFLTIDDVDRLDGHSFEVLCSLLWSKRGFQTQVTPKRGGDGGIDIVALKGKDGELIQCKSSINADLGWDAIKEVSGGAARYQARFAGTRLRKVAITNQGFNASAIEQAAANQVDLITRRQLEEFLGMHPVTNLEFDDALVEASV